MRKKNEERQIVWWNLLTMLAMVGLSFALINAEGKALFYALIAALFLCVGIFIKRAYIFLGIMIFVLVLVFITKDGLFSSQDDENSSVFDFHFFINSSSSEK